MSDFKKEIKKKDLIKKMKLFVDEGEIASFLQNLIQAPSVNPPGNTVKVAEICMNKLSEAGIKCEQVYGHPSMPSVIGVLGENSGPVLCFHAHIDTVEPGDINQWSYPPFSGTISDGKIYGRGAGDCKGSVAAQVMAAVILRRAAIPISGKLCVACVSDEEAGGRYGTQYLKAQGLLHPDYLVIGEQTNNEVAIAERGAVWLKITVKGKATHGALPWSGENAILRMGHILKEIHDVLLPQLESKKHRYLPGSTINIGVIQGGIQVNIVPDICSIEIDRRILPNETRESVLNEMKVLIDNVQKDIGKFPYSIEVVSDMSVSVNTDSEDSFVKLFKNTFDEFSGTKPVISGYMQGSDGRFFAKDGIPIVIFGPSDPKVGHSANEFCQISQLVQATGVLAAVAINLLN